MLVGAPEQIAGSAEAWFLWAQLMTFNTMPHTLEDGQSPAIQPKNKGSLIRLPLDPFQFQWAGTPHISVRPTIVERSGGAAEQEQEGIIRHGCFQEPHQLFGG